MERENREIKLAELEYPNYGLIFYKIRRGIKDYILIYRKSKRVGIVKIRQNIIKSFISFIKFINVSLKLDLSISEAKKIFYHFGYNIDLPEDKIQELLLGKRERSYLLKAKQRTREQVILPYIRVSKTENILAKYLKKLEIPFKRQVMIGNYIVDFLIKPNIVVEVEGPVHYRKEVAEKDHRKVNYLESQGYDVYRFYYRDILKDPERIAKMIYERWKEKLLRIQRD
jgi:very-short-patch-repair endonuclease